jgi:cytochrome c2
MKVKQTLLAGLICLVTISAHADPLEIGKTIFTTRCAACHNVNKVIIGPALAGVDKRRSIAWILKFVNSSQSMVKSGDKDALALFEKFTKVVMPDHPDLKAADIESIVAYINSETRTVSNTAPFARPGKMRADHMPLGADDDIFFILYLGGVAALVRALVYVVQLNTYKRNSAENTTA